MNIMQQEKEKIFNYLNKNSSSKEQKEVEQWISESSENANVYWEVKKLHELSFVDNAAFSPDVDKAWNKVSENLFDDQKGKVVQVNFGFIMKIAAMMILTVGLGYFFFFNSTELNEIATFSGQIQQIELPDGTQVWLNENSSFKYPERFAYDSREVFLDGEAYFDVVKNTKKPFVIRSKDTYTQVLGTSFNLYTVKGKSKVDVISGKVALVDNSDKNNKVILTKGEQGLLSEGEIKKSNKFDTNAIAWKTKKIVFESTKIAEVASVLQDYYDVNIEYDESLSNCLITSTFEDKSLEEIFEVLNVIAQIEYKNNDGVYYLTGPGC